MAGGFLGVIIGSKSSEFVYYLIAFAAGNFIYIASVDLVPELNREMNLKKSLLELLFIILGVLVIALLGLL